jgi:class 3 adenylate cyclase
MAKLKLKIGKETLDKAIKRRQVKAEGRASLLIVDDEIANCEVLRQLLQDDYVTHVSTSPIDALRIARSNPIDMVITDQRMPEMLGTQFLEKLLEESQDQARIILSGYTDANDLITCINKGLIEQIITKPWEPDKLLKVIQESLIRLHERRTLRKLIPQSILTRLYPEGIKNVQAGYGTEIQCALLFFDVRGFTTMAESMAPTDTFKFITSLLNHIAPIVQQYGGFIDKYMGDGFLAVFDDAASYSQNALDCALALHRETQVYNLKHRSGPPPKFREGHKPRQEILIGVGLFSGRVVLGTVGHTERIEFTVLGDAVNTAARIQDLTKQFCCDLLADSSVMKGVSGFEDRRFVGNVKLRGKVKSLALYDVFAHQSEELRESKRQSRDSFEMGVREMEGGNKVEAQNIFAELAQQHSEDTVIQYFQAHSGA